MHLENYTTFLRNYLLKCRKRRYILFGFEKVIANTTVQNVGSTLATRSLVF